MTLKNSKKEFYCGKYYPKPFSNETKTVTKKIHTEFLLDEAAKGNQRALFTDPKKQSELVQSKLLITLIYSIMFMNLINLLNYLKLSLIIANLKT